MDTALVIIVAAVVFGLVLLLFTRKGKPELPKGDEKAPDRTSAESAPAREPDTTSDTAAAPAPKQAIDEDVGGPDAAAKEEARAPDVEAAEPSTPEHASEVEAPATEPEHAAEADTEERGETTREQDVAALRKGLASTRGGLISRLAKLFGGGQKQIDSGLLEEIEEVLITADVGVKTTQRILDELRDRMQSGELQDEESVWAGIRAQAEAILSSDAPPVELEGNPAVLLIAGVNGVGKTTTIGKLASRYSDSGKKVLLAAGDTYRAAAVLQLEMWGERVNCPVVKGKANADPASVIFEAIKRARDEGFDLVIADTAGRLHTKQPLMEELKKLERTIAKATGGRPADEIFLVLDSTTGQNAVQQAHMFREALNVSGVVLTKLDGTAKGGVILGIVDQHKIPVRFIGLGERVEDLRAFDPHTFVEALFAKPGDETLAA